MFPTPVPPTQTSGEEQLAHLLIRGNEGMSRLFPKRGVSQAARRGAPGC